MAIFLASFTGQFCAGLFVPVLRPFIVRSEPGFIYGLVYYTIDVPISASPARNTNQLLTLEVLLFSYLRIEKMIISNE